MSKQGTIIFDLDGTAVDSPSQILPSERLVTAVRQAEQAYTLCAATGRPWSFAAPVLQALGLTDPCIIAGGARICNPQTGEVLSQITMDEADVEAVITILQRYPTYHLLSNDYQAEAYVPGGGTKPAEFTSTEPLYFLEVIYVPETSAPKLLAELSEIEGVTATLVVAQLAGYNDIHITARDATKEHTVAELLRVLQADPQQTIGIGDGHNDIHLFRAVAHKVAMGNAVPELKAQADQVIGTVSKDGLAEYLEALISRA